MICSRLFFAFKINFQALMRLMLMKFYFPFWQIKRGFSCRINCSGLFLFYAEVRQYALMHWLC